MALSGKQRRYLRALGHALNPVVQVGRGGLSDPVIEAVETALVDHELIKVKIGQGSELERQGAADELARRTGSEVAQVLGNTVLLYRAHPERPVIELPAADRPRPAD
ncbi:MAG TPA: ribosome assembly RNA-binding protein YhbY [Kofleriaceae bacterium]|nr:ribosome assembly RNA-binding protein YhbY [Kofleriaceae bacterium]